MISPEVQIAAWGLATTGCFMATLATIDDEDGFLRIIAGSLISLFWVINVTMWFTATVSWMLITDSIFTVLALWFYRWERQHWCLILALLYGMSVSFDIVFALGLISYQTFALMLDVPFAAQLLTISLPGWKKLFNRINSAIKTG